MSDARTNPPTRLPSPPRAVRWKRVNKRNTWILRVFLVPFMAVGVIVPAILLLRLYTASYGTPIQATIDGKSVVHTHDSHGNHTTYRVQYHFALNGKTYRDRQQVRFEGYENAYVGMQVPARVTVIWGHYYSLLNYGGVDSTNWFLAIFAAVWDLVILLGIVKAWLQPVRDRSLVESGNVAVGSVTKCVAQRNRRGNTGYYTMSYQFDSPEGGTVTRKQMIGAGSSPTPIPDVGDPVTVLYDPARPKLCLAYEYCGFEIATS
jgi:hypothetical protein